MTKTNFPIWDIKFYYGIHINRQKMLGCTPVSYPQFYRRLRSWMTLHDAIYTPRCEYNVRNHKKHPIQDHIRRVKTLKDENVQVIDLPPIQKPMARYNMKPPKKTTLRERFLSLFKK